jgi:hypothetical protein
VLGSVLKPAVDMIVNVIKIGMALITGVVKTATALLRGDWTGAWNAIKATVSQVWPLIKAAVAAGIAAVKAIIVAAANGYKAVLSAAWSAIKAAASAAWNALPGLISAAWGAIKSATSAAVSALLGFVRSGFAQLPGIVGGALAKIPGLLASAASAAGAAAISIGSRIVSGIMSGLGGIAGRMKSYLEGQLKSALSSLNPFSPVEDGGKKYIGDPIALGAMKGLILGFRDLPDKVSDRVKAIVEAGKKAVDSSRGRIAGAFQRMGELVMRAFDRATEDGLDKIKDKYDERLSRLTAEFQTPTEKLIEKMEDERQQKQLEDAVKDASDTLAQAQADATRGATGTAVVGEEGESPEERAKQQAQANAAVLDAQKQLQEAQYALQMRGLQAKAAAERLAEEQRRAGEIMQIEHKIAVATREFEAQREIQRYHLGQEMAALESQLANEGMKRSEANKKITEMMKAHGLSMKGMGELMGESFAKGLRDSQKEVAKSAEALARVVQRYLKLQSPAETGPLSDLDKWWKPFAPTIVASVDTRQVAGVASAIARSALGPVPTSRGHTALAAYSASQGAHGGGIEKLVNIEGDLVVRDETDADSVASMLSRKIVTARVAT